jgi:hypothetical protein
MSNANSFASVQLSVAPVPSTETIALFPGRSADTTRANSLLSLDPDLVQQGRWDGRPFRVVVAGNVQASASENITIAVYANVASTANTNLTTFTNDIKVITGTTMATGAAGSLAFYASTICMWNSTSSTAGRLAFFPEPGGLQSISGTSAVWNSTSTAVIGNSGTAISIAQTRVQFYVTTLTGTADATSTASIDFHLDQI